MDVLITYQHECFSSKCNDGRLAMRSVTVDQDAYEIPVLYCVHTNAQLKPIAKTTFVDGNSVVQRF